MVGVNIQIGKANYAQYWNVQMNSANISKEHNYSMSSISAVSIKRLSERVKISKLNRKIYGLRRQVKANKKYMEKKYSKFENFDELPKFIQEFFATVLKYFKKTSHPKKYSPEMRQFALTLHYYSPTAYEFVREVFIFCLPFVVQQLEIGIFPSTESLVFQAKHC